MSDGYVVICYWLVRFFGVCCVKVSGVANAHRGILVANGGRVCCVKVSGVANAPGHPRCKRRTSGEGYVVICYWLVRFFGVCCVKVSGVANAHRGILVANGGRVCCVKVSGVTNAHRVILVANGGRVGK